MLFKSYIETVQQNENNLDALIWKQFIRRGKTEIGGV